MGNSAILVVFGRMGPVWAPGAQNGPYSSISQWWEGYLGPTPWPGQIPLFPLSLSGGRGIWAPQGPRAPPPGQIPLFPLSLSGGRGIWAPRPGGAKYPYFLYLSVVGGVKMTPWGRSGGCSKGSFLTPFWDPFLGPLFGTHLARSFGKNGHLDLAI